ncbi:MAG: GNAT family N-acetyltransferase [Pseudomonadota bacterium]
MTEPAPLTPDAVDAVAALARVVWQATYPGLITQAQIDAMLADRYAASRIRAQLDAPDHAWRVVLADGAPVGFAHACLDETGCKLDKLYVHPEHQRRGLGQALLGAVEAWARERQAPRLWLQVNRGNEAAIRAYARYGFAIFESRVFDIGNGFVMDDYLMEKAL